MSSLRFLVDVNVGLAVSDSLRDSGYDLTSGNEWHIIDEVRGSGAMVAQRPSKPFVASSNLVSRFHLIIKARRRVHKVPCACVHCALMCEH